MTEECGKYGAVVSAKVKPASAGFIYMKFADQVTLSPNPNPSPNP